MKSRFEKQQEQRREAEQDRYNEGIVEERRLKELTKVKNMDREARYECNGN